MRPAGTALGTPLAGLFVDPVRRKAGVIANFNQKSVTVLTEDGYRYNVAPRLLTPEDNTRS